MGGKLGGGGLEKVPSPPLQLWGWSHKEASLGAKDAGIDGSNLAGSLRLARTWPLLLFFKPRILSLQQLYLDAGAGPCRREEGGMLLQEARERSGDGGSGVQHHPQQYELLCADLLTHVNDFVFDQILTVGEKVQ